MGNCGMILENTRRKSWPDMAARGEQETQRITIHGGPVRVIYRDDDIVIPKKTNSRTMCVIFTYAAFLFGVNIFGCSSFIIIKIDFCRLTAAFRVDIPSKRYTTRTGGPRIACV